MSPTEWWSPRICRQGVEVKGASQSTNVDHRELERRAAGPNAILGGVLTELQAWLSDRRRRNQAWADLNDERTRLLEGRRETFELDQLMRLHVGLTRFWGLAAEYHFARRQNEGNDVMARSRA